MKNKKFLYLVFILLHFLNGNILSEVLKRETEFKLKPSGPDIIRLFSGVYIDTDFPDINYVRSMLMVIINKSNINDGDIISIDTELFSEKGEKIGDVLNQFEALLPEVYTEGKTKVYVRGYIPKNAIDSSSITEYYLNSLLSSSSFPILKKDIEKNLEEQHYRDWLNYDSFNSKIKFDSELIGSPETRVLIVSLADNVFAIIHPGIIDKVNNYECSKKNYYSIQYLNNDKKLQKRFEEGFYYQFISSS